MNLFDLWKEFQMCWQVHILHLNTVFIFTNLVTITTIIILLSLYCDHFYYKICVLLLVSVFILYLAVCLSYMNHKK